MIRFDNVQQQVNVLSALNAQMRLVDLTKERGVDALLALAILARDVRAAEIVAPAPVDEGEDE